MLNLNDLFLDFNDNLTLKKKYKDLVITGRNALRNKIGSKFEENDRKKPKYFMQGSYAMNTAINPEEDEEFDLDDGVYLQGYSDDKDTWPATTTVHDWVKKAVDKHTSNDPIDKNTCVRVVYEEKYHIDLPIYIMGEDDADNACAYLAHSILKNNLLEYNLEAVSYWNTKAESFVVMLRFDESFSHYIWAYQMTKSSYVCSDSKIELITFIRRLLGLDIDEQDLKQVLFVKSDVVITMLISKLTDVYLWLIGKKNEKLYFDYMSKNNSPSLIISSFNNTVGDCLLGIKIGKLKSNNVRITRKNIAGVLRANSGRRFEKIQICDMRMKRLFTRGGDGRAMFDKANYVIDWFGRMKWARMNSIAIKPRYRSLEDRTINIQRIDID